MHPFLQRLSTAFILVGLFLFIFYCLPSWTLSALFLLILIYILIIEWPKLCTSVWLWLLTPLYPIMPFALMIFLQQTDRYALFTLIAFVTIFDSSAYIIGNLVGNHKLAPAISPKKTWEGVLGGLMVMLMLRHWLFCAFSIMLIILLCAAAVIGDLFESWLKRRAGIKDTGSLLPGHGGLLDRFDALMATTVLYVLLKT